MTTEELDAIAARANVASPAPWEANNYDVRAPWIGHPDRPMKHCATFPFIEDADFVAHARSDVPHLIAEVRRLQVEVDCWRALAETAPGYNPFHHRQAVERGDIAQCRQLAAELRQHIEALYTDRDALRTDNEKLVSALQQALAHAKPPDTVAVPRAQLERTGSRLEALAKRAGGRIEDFALVDELRALLEGK